MFLRSTKAYIVIKTKDGGNTFFACYLIELLNSLLEGALETKSREILKRITQTFGENVRVLPLNSVI